MSTTLKLKKSSVGGKVPTTSDLEYGELALNYADGCIYYKNSSNAIKKFAVIPQTAKTLDSAQNFSLTGDITASAVSFNGSAAVALNTSIASGVIVNDDINASAAIADTKLSTISTSGKVSNSATTGTAANTGNTLVLRDAEGDFAANQITGDDFRIDGYGLVIDSAGVWQGSQIGVKGEPGTSNYAVTVVSDGGDKFALDGTTAPSITNP